MISRSHFKFKPPLKNVEKILCKQNYVALLSMFILLSIQFFMHKKTNLFSKFNCNLLFDTTSSNQEKNCLHKNEQKVKYINKKIEAKVKVDPKYLKKNIQANCSILDVYDWNKNDIKPRFKLRKNKFLFPLLYNGPNNQMLGFQQSMTMAVLLNRTLILPNFYKHQFGTSELKTIIKAEEKLNIDKIRELISVEPIENGIKMCDSTINIIFNANPNNQGSLLPSLLEYYVENGLKTLNLRNTAKKSYIKDDLKNKENLNLKNAWKRHMEKNWLKAAYLPSPNSTDILEITKAFNTEDRCAIYFKPFRQLKLDLLHTGSLKFDYKTFKGASMLNGLFFKNLKPPSFLIEFKNTFIKTIIDPKNTGYIAVHWRYDKNDFYNYLCRNHLINKRKTMCENVNLAIQNSTAIAMAIVLQINEVLVRENRIIDKIYIAAPSTLFDFIRRTSESLKRIFYHKYKVNVRVFSLVDLKMQAEQLFSCLKHEKNYLNEDWLSMVEMEICSDSYIFVRSQQSTWTQHVQFNRYFLLKKNKNHDPVVLDLVKKVYDESL